MNSTTELTDGDVGITADDWPAIAPWRRLTTISSAAAGDCLGAERCLLLEPDAMSVCRTAASCCVTIHLTRRHCRSHWAAACQRDDAAGTPSFGRERFRREADAATTSPRSQRPPGRIIFLPPHGHFTAARRFTLSPADRAEIEADLLRWGR